MESWVRLREFVDAGDGHVDLEMAQAGLLVVIAFGRSYEDGVGAGPLNSGRGGFVIGAQSGYGRSRLRGRAEGVQVELSWSAAVRVFGPAIADLGDQAASLADLSLGPSSGKTVTDRVSETQPGGRAAVVERWLRSVADRQPAANPTVLRALTLIDAGTTNVSALARDLGCSRGYLHRVIRSAIGQPPSVLLRVARLYRLLGTGPGASSWAERAERAGYADHAHLCHEARTLTGRAPTELSIDGW